MRLINLDDILKKFPKADFDGDDLENMKAYPRWKTDITGLFDILKSVPTIETCEDCISRAEVLGFLKGFEILHNHDELRSNLIYGIMNMPPVTPTRPKGHNENNDYADCDQFVCSECGIELQDWHRVERDIDDGNITYHEYTFKYCPNCGAKMEVEE